MQLASNKRVEKDQEDSSKGKGSMQSVLKVREAKVVKNKEDSSSHLAALQVS